MRSMFLLSIGWFWMLATLAAACESHSGPLNRPGELWVVAHSIDPDEPGATSIVARLYDKMIVPWPCAEVLRMNNGRVALTVGTVPTAQAAALVEQFKSRKQDPLPPNAQQIPGALFSERIINSIEWEQLRNVVTADTLTEQDLLLNDRDRPGLRILRLSSDGRVTVRSFAPNSTQVANGSWRKSDVSTVCISIDSENCWRFEINGSGLGIRSAVSGRVRSDVVLRTGVDVLASANHRFTLPNRVEDQVTVIGRTIRDREIWVSHLYANGRFEFFGSTGQLSTGSYRLSKGQACYVFDGGSTEVCRYPETVSTTRILWQNPNGEAPISEVVAVLEFVPISASANIPVPLDKKTPHVVTIPRPSTERPREEVPSSSSTQTVRPRQARACRDISTFCWQFTAKASVCSIAFESASDNLAGGDSGFVGAAASGATCSALLSDMEGLPITAQDLAISALGTAVTSHAFENKGFWAGLASLGVSSGIGYLSCQQSLTTACGN